MLALPSSKPFYGFRIRILKRIGRFLRIRRQVSQISYLVFSSRQHIIQKKLRVKVLQKLYCPILLIVLALLVMPIYNLTVLGLHYIVFFFKKCTFNFFIRHKRLKISFLTNAEFFFVPYHFFLKYFFDLLFHFFCYIFVSRDFICWFNSCMNKSVNFFSNRNLLFLVVKN